MITTPTLFIIGAGASVPYGFPSGEQLMRLIESGSIDLPKHDSGWMAGVDPLWNEIPRFMQDFKYLPCPSIDDFLRYRQDYLVIGKRYIAAALIPHEDPNALLKHSHDDHWLKIVWNAMICDSPHDVVKNKVGFIVYNYDRCIEHLFTMALAVLGKMSAGEAWSICRNINIVHPHGLLGNYTCTAPFITRHGRFFDKNVDAESIYEAASHINLFWEPRKPEDDRLSRMEAMIAEADRIIFLGFGFLKSNLEHLAPMFAKRDKGRSLQMLATGKGLPENDKRRAERMLRLSVDNIYDNNSSWLLKHKISLDE